MTGSGDGTVISLDLGAHLLQAGAVLAGNVVVWRNFAQVVENGAGLFITAQFNQGFGQPVQGFDIVGKQFQYGAVDLGRALPIALEGKVYRLTVQATPELRSISGGRNFGVHPSPSIIWRPGPGSLESTLRLLPAQRNPAAPSGGRFPFCLLTVISISRGRSIAKSS